MGVGTGVGVGGRGGGGGCAGGNVGVGDGVESGKPGGASSSPAVNFGSQSTSGPLANGGIRQRAAPDPQVSRTVGLDQPSETRTYAPLSAAAIVVGVWSLSTASQRDCPPRISAPANNSNILPFSATLPAW